MPHNLIIESPKKTPAHLLKSLYLPQSEVVLRRHIARRKMREDTTHLYPRIHLDTPDELINILREETEPVHSRIKLYMNTNRDRRLTLTHSLFQLRQTTETIDVGLKTVLDNHIESVGLRRHHHDRQPDALVPKLHTLISVCNSKILNVMECQKVRHLETTTPVCERLHHNHDFRLFP